MLVLPESAWNRLLTEAQTSFPAECCGLLEGVRTVSEVRVTTVHPTANVAPDPLTGFLIDPEAHFRLLRVLRGSGRGVVGCYHSHPNGRSGPSPRDRATSCEDGFAWVIIATGVKSRLAAFQSPGFAPMEIAIQG